MNILFVQEARYIHYKGELYSKRITYNTYWNRYLTSFEKVTILARVKMSNKLPDNFLCATGFKVNFAPITDYEGPIAFLKNIKSISMQIEEALKIDAFTVLRIPSHLGVMVYKKLKKLNKPFCVEVVGNPNEVGKFLPLPFVLKKAYTYFMTSNMKNIVKNSIGALYVTQYHLQKIYPPKSDAINKYASNVYIPDNLYLSNLREKNNAIKTIKERVYDSKKEPIKIGVIGMLYSIKSSLEIVEAFYILIKKGYNLKLEFVGEGPLLKEIILKSKQLKISKRVICNGSLPSGEKVFSFIDSLDLYIQFSKTEGLPRAMIEAMARCCPIVSSNVGGISELLPSDLLVTSMDIKGLANKIDWLLNNETRLLKAVNDNHVKSKEYLNSNLMQKRLDFYKKVKNKLIKNI